MDDRDMFLHYRTPTATRPLLGLTILVVEDSRYACEALRLMCLRSGARIRRADCLQSARRHLKVYRPSVAIVDLGLPDGSGTDLIEDLAQATPRVGVILGLSGDDGAEGRAMAAGADGFLAKPVTSLGIFQQAILDHLSPDRQPTGPRQLSNECIEPDPLAYRDDMAHVAEVLEESNNAKTLDYIAQFLTGVSRAADDHQMTEAALALARCRAEGHPAQHQVARIAGLVQNRIADRLAI